MKVYTVISEEENYLYGREASVEGVFASLDNAKLKMKEFFEKACSDREEFEDKSVTENEMFVEFTYEDWYSVKIIECELQ